MSQLITEMLWYAKRNHAKVVFDKCVKNGRFKTAAKIALHYNLQDENNNNDTCIALALACFATTNRD